MTTHQPWNANVPGLQVYWPGKDFSILEFYGLTSESASVPSLAIWAGRKLAYAAGTTVERRTDFIDYVFSETPPALRSRGWSIYPGTIRVMYQRQDPQAEPLSVRWSLEEDPEFVELEKGKDWKFIPPPSPELRLNPKRSKSLVLRTDRPDQAILKLVSLSQRPRCALSDCEVVACIDLAHIVPVRNGGPELIANTLLLRADLHRLFDAGLLKFRIRSSNCVAEFHESLRGDKILGTLHQSRLTVHDLSAMEPYFRERERLEQLASEA